MHLAHLVYFTLKEDSPAAREKLVGDCKRYLSVIPGTASFAAGTVVADLDREVNDRDWHVALHVVFVDRKAHDDYQTAPLHLTFIERNKETWAKVRVFDALVESVPPRG